MKAKQPWLLLCLLLLLFLFPLLSHAETVFFEDESFSKDAEYIDMGNTVITDFGAFTAFLDQFPNLRHVDMWQNRMTKEQCDMLAERYPHMRWGWTMVIRNQNHSHLVRTDYTSWSTLHNNRSAHHTSEDFTVLKYCWDLRALDVGHNSVTDLDFLYDLPNLRVLIIACNSVTDITPIASLKHLEYAELFNNKIRDITPLKGLTHLLDLNLCFNRISDLSPVTNLTHLQRLWLYSCEKRNTPPSGEGLEAVKAALPDTWIDTTHYSTNGGWRRLSEKELHPHYAVIQKIFGENHLKPKTEYVPFEDSWPEEEEQSAPETPAKTEAPAAPVLEPLVPQDFSDRKYLLPIDFSSGRAPLASGFGEGLTYSDPTISVTVKSGTLNFCDYWYADIVVKDASQLRTMAASMDGSFNDVGQMDALRLAERAGAVVAVNGDNWNSEDKRGLGYIIRQGILYQNNLDGSGKWDAPLMDVLLIDEAGDFVVYKRPTAGTVPSTVNGKRILNAFSFGPVLVENGEAVPDFNNAHRWLDMAYAKRRQRVCICQVDHLHYMVICCAGPLRKNRGMTVREFSRLAASLGVRTAYNLDGGDSTLLYFGGKRINEFGSKSQRKLMDIIYFASGQ